MALVVDASAIVSQVLDDEDASFAEATITAVREHRAIVPSLFWFEIRNVLVTGERRKRISPERSTAFLTLIAGLPIDSEHIPPEAGLMDMARRYELSVYDAAYLELAVRTSSRLATLDGQLRDCAERAGVALFEGEYAD